MARYTAGSVEVKVVPDLDGLHQKIARATRSIKDIKIGVDVDADQLARKVERATNVKTPKIEVDADTTKAKRKIDVLAKDRKFKVDTDVTGALAGMLALSKLTDSATRKATRLGIALSAAALAAMALNATAGAIGGIGAALAAASGAALLLPGAIGAGIAAAAALKLGFAGVGDAISAIAEGDAEKLEEAIKKLAPSAQEFVRTIASMRGQFVELQQSVQNALFRDLAAPFREMATAVLPLLKAGLTGIAEEFNTIARRAMYFFTQAGVLRDMGAMFEGTRVVVRNLGEAFTPLLRVFTDIAAVGISVIADLTGGVGAAAQGFAVFIEKARESGQLEAWIRNGISALGDLFATLGNIGGIIAEVFGAANAHGSNFISVAREATGELRGFLASAQGQELLTTFFTNLRAAIDAIRPGLIQIGEVISDLVTTIAPSLPAVGAAFSAIVNALRPFADIVINLVGFVLPGLLWFLQNIGPWLVSMAVPVLALIGAMKVWAAVTTAVKIAQAALNLVMAANPIMLIVLAVGALIGALIYAYNNIGWFRDAVNAAFEGIKVAVKAVGDFFVWLWQSVIVPAWQGIVAAAEWAWNNILKPIFDAIGFALRFLGAVIFTVLVAPFQIAFNLVAAAATWLWENALRPVFGWIADGWRLLMEGVNWVWQNILRPAWDAVAAAARWLWDNVLRPVFDWIGAAWQNHLRAMDWAWKNILKPAWDAVSAAARWLWDNVLRPVFDAIGAGWRLLMDGIRWVYDHVLRPCFDAVRDAVHNVGVAFDNAVRWIGDVWNTIRGILAKPINFVIQSVYNDGIRAAWNKVAGWLKLPELAPMATIPGYATGGAVRDATGGGRVPGVGNKDTVPAMLMPGEYVISKKVVRQWGMDNIHAAHTAARAGRRVGPEGMLQKFAAGGRVEEAKRFARSQHGKPYQWGGVGNPSYDCSGFMSAIHNVLVGRPPNSRRYTTHPFEGGRPYGGFVRGLSSAFTIGVQPGHMAGTLDGMNVESSGSNGVQAGGRARGSSSFPWTFSLPEVGGEFVDGGGGGSFFGDFLKNLINLVLNPIRGAIGGTVDALVPGSGEPGTWKSGVKGAALKVVDEPKNWLFRKIDELFGFSGGGGNIPPGSGPVMDQVRNVANTFGWGTGPQWDALVRLVQKESSWNPNAANPTSSARGLFQKMTSIHGPLEPTPAQQAGWGLNYIRSRYGDPIRALAFHNAHGWYAKGGPVVKPSLFDNGGILPPTPNGYGLYANHTGRNEAVLTNEQMGWLRSAANNGTSGVPVTVNNNIETRVDASPEAIAQATTRLAKRAFRGVK